MRTLLAIAIIFAGTSVPAAAQDGYRSARRAKPPVHSYGPPRYYYRQPRYYYGQPRYYDRERAVCEERAQAADPTGLYAGYPCWAREAFGRGSSGGRR